MSKKEQIKTLCEAYYLIKDIIEIRLGYYEDRSEGWQESDKGLEYEETTESIESAADELESVFRNLEV
tara:strand:+ start:97 stop:300 length:204 start_codon:yes stop_codon:yes gene_type:complete